MYIARYASKNIVAAGFANKCEINVAYCIGVKEPVSVTVNTFGTSTVDEQILEDAVKKVFDFTPGGIIKQFSLISPSWVRGWTYKELGMYGHIGNPKTPWEKTDKVQELQKAVVKLIAKK